MQINGLQSNAAELLTAATERSGARTTRTAGQVVESPVDRTVDPPVRPLPVLPVEETTEGELSRPIERRLARLLDRLEKLFDRLERADRSERSGKGAEIDDRRLTRYVSKQLHRIDRVVHHGLKAIAKELAQGAGATDEPGAERDVNRAVNRIGKLFRHDLREAFRQARSREPLDGEQLVASVREAFDRLVGNLGAVLEALGTPERPGTEIAYDGTRVIRFEYTATVERSVSTTRSETPVTDRGDERVARTDSEAGAKKVRPLDLRSIFRRFGERFESLVSDLRNLPAGQDGTSGVKSVSQSFEIQARLVASFYSETNIEVAAEDTGGQVNVVR